MKSINNINQLNKSDFLSVFGNIFEKTEWIAEEVFNLKPFENIDDLFAKMINQYKNCSKEQALLILNSHPELAIEKKLTKFSSKEQTGAQLDLCSKEELLEFEKLNLDYENKFKFPFIIAVKGKSKKDILDSFRERINNNYQKEFNEAKNQVMKIALFRLNEIL